MKVKLLLCLTLLISTFSYSQSFKILGKVVDPEGEPLESATVYVEKPADSSLVTYTISEDDGKFLLEGNTKAPLLNLYVSYAGYKPFKKGLDVKEGVDLGTIKMEVLDNQLDAVTITGDRAPVTLKSDTLEFNAASFKTRENANLEDVLKELPGVEVDNDGNITVNGKPVKRILVNGKEFFGDDPKIATKNLPKELINKIQVVDTKTKSQEFTGKEGDSENKTINITIDEDKNHGLFSRLTAGAGTDERYELSGIANYFNNDLRISLLGSSNNINSAGFSFDEVFDAMGRNGYSIMSNGKGSFVINGVSYGNMGGGITSSDNLGLNFANEWKDKTELTGNYFFNNADNRSETKIRRENFLPNRHYFNNSTSSSTKQNDNHRLSLGFEIQPDTLTRISVRPNLIVNEGKSQMTSFTESLEEDGAPRNRANTENFSEVSSRKFSNDFDVTRKFGENGGYVKAGFSNKNNKSEDDNNLYTERELYDKNGNLFSTEIQDQLIKEKNTKDDYEVETEARIPLSEVLKLDAEYRFDKGKSRNERLVYENSDANNYSMLVDTLSNDFRSETFDHRPSLGLVYEKEGLRASISGGLQSIRLKNEDLFTETSFDNTYQNLFLSTYLRYKLSKTKTIYFNYRNSSNAPRIKQLQPVQNTLNPLNVTTGNPDLKPEVEHQFYGNFNNFDFKSRSGFFIYVGGNFSEDKVVSYSVVDEDLVRNTTYKNVDGTYSFFGGLHRNKTYELKNENSIRLRGGLNWGYNKYVGFSNGELFNSKTFNISPRVGAQYELKEVLTIEPSYNLHYFNTDYSLNDSRDEEYVNHRAGVEITSYWPKNFIIGNDISYHHLGNVSPGFKNSYVMWNASLGYKLLGDDGIFKVKMFDVLNENVSTQRHTGENFVQDTQELVLKQYLMFSFTYKISKFAGKDPNRGRRRRMRF